MKRLGLALMIGGAVVGTAVVAGMLGGFHLALPWIVNVALGKLTLVASGGMMTAGAVVRRYALRADSRDMIGPGEKPSG